MFILTQFDSFENIKNNVCRVQDEKIEEQYLEAGYRLRERCYKIHKNYTDYVIICPEYRNDAKGLEPVVITPEFLVPGRPYPIYVYLYAIDLYSRMPKKGQRWVAAQTRKKFGLSTFAHTTVGRAMKAFAHNISGVSAALKGTATEKASKAKSSPLSYVIVALCEQVASFLDGIFTQSKKQQVIDTSCKLAKEWYQKHRRFLL
jgi:hypothetical protein